MKSFLSFFSIGLFLGILFIKSEVASWFRIYEMFQFKSFHMYGIIGTAIVLGIILTKYIKITQAKDFNGDEILISPKEKGITRYLTGGIIFGLGWALAGACPGPMFVLLGSLLPSILVLILGALLGTFVYGMLRSKLPH
ncbi:DUF6691 family protein [Lacinutrix sp. MedPE-SW]|uniref:DUF6691 family protein n=1 Tax=Lacinutrix sp. MedPE-SW TaxID=1860087 RepID=UPI0009134535|nr:DUF6691 family protein [Lacinutrix sp. MedPE-SW]OIQ22294.1 MAG: transporter [Lacinutrix sp. MedPE-SW]